MCNKKSLYIFDLDNTLVTTQCMVILNRGGQEYFLSSKEYSQYDRIKGDKLDFTMFDRLIKPKMIPNIIPLFKKQVENSNSDVIILTARRNVIRPHVEFFLEEKNINSEDIKVVGVNSSQPEAKSNWILNKLRNNSYSKLFFYDDCERTRYKVDSELFRKNIEYYIIDPDGII